ncbi:MAG: hypothetical protein IPK97_10475 [Ahniella sp.]|nr:hypothetical protein [Ahniella sp.]
MSRPTRFLQVLLATGALSTASLVHADIPLEEPNLEDQLMSANGLYQLRYSDNQFSPHFMPQSQVQAAADASTDRVYPARVFRWGTTPASRIWACGHHSSWAASAT